MGKKSAVLVAALIILPLYGFAEDITLVKHARRVESLEAERYTVQKGDTLWKIFLRNFKANKEDMPYLYKKFRELNPRVKDLNHIVSGQKVIIPRMPEQGSGLSVKAASGDVYVIRKGQHLAMVLRQVYGLPDDLIFNEYLNLIKEMNPEIEDLNHVEPGQTIKMPKTDEIVSAVEKMEIMEEKAAEVIPAKPASQKMAQITDIPETPEKEPQEEPIAEEPPVETKKAVIVEIPEPEVEDKFDQAVSMKTEPVVEIELREPVKSPSEEPIIQEEIKPPAEEMEEKPVPESTPGITEKTVELIVPEPKKHEVSKQEIKKESEQVKVVEEKKALKEEQKARKEQIKTASAGKVQGPPVGSPAGDSASRDTGVAGDEDTEKRQLASRLVRNTLMPALARMGGSSRDEGTYFMPMSGGSSISIDTSEIPVMELDTGRRIILDVNNKISAPVKDLLEKTFPSCSIISGPSADIEGLMDRVLNVSGYFSINKDASPLLVGEDEKVKFSGKWIVYKDYTRHNVFVVNILSNKEEKTPEMIRKYASRFGIDLIELGGRAGDKDNLGPADIKKLEHSYAKLFDEVGIAYETEKVLDLVSLDSVKITYKAPIILGSTILTRELPEETMLDLLRGRNYTVIHTAKASVEEILNTLDIEMEGPPVRVVIAERRTELELPALKVKDAIILKRSIDRDIGAYLASRGKRVLMW